MVPDHFITGLGNGEGVVAALGEIRQAITVVDRGNGGCTFFRVLVHLGRQVDGAVGRVHRDLVGLGVALEHRHLAVGKLALVLFHVSGSDDEQRLFIGERIGQEALAVDSAGILRNTTGIRRDRAIGITGLFRAQGGQGSA
ncbi:hypothetical protein D9M73_159130 [compost metagenome]